MKKTLKIIGFVTGRFILYTLLGLSLFLALDYINNLENSIIVIFMKNNTRLIMKLSLAIGFGMFCIRMIND